MCCTLQCRAISNPSQRNPNARSTLARAIFKKCTAEPRENLRDIASLSESNTTHLDELPVRDPLNRLASQRLTSLGPVKVPATPRA